MASIVLGVATSHSPVLTLESRDWYHCAQTDYANPTLTLADGRALTYAELAAEAGERYGEVATLDVFDRIAGRCQDSLNHIAREIEAAEPDVVIIVGDDQGELFRSGNIPAIALYWGDEIVTRRFGDDLPDWLQTMATGYGMDEVHRFAGAPVFARALIEGLIAQDVDLSIYNEVPDPAAAAFGHAFGFPVKRLFGDRAIPIVPVMLNTYYPPNVLSSSRCLDIGRAIRRATESCGLDLRVAVLASGGLSHFVVEEDLDRYVVDNLAGERVEALRTISRKALLEGSSEILNWVVTAGAVSHLPLSWSCYEPLRRTSAGTGIGLGFAVWGGAS